MLEKKSLTQDELQVKIKELVPDLQSATMLDRSTRLLVMSGLSASCTAVG